ncbi:MAG: hypothetical protein AB7Q17_06970 [Phycisphaerae bacterium]
MFRPNLPPVRRGLFFRVALLACGALAPCVIAQPDRPRLLLRPKDVPRVRHACGLGSPAPDAAGFGKFGAGADHYAALRLHFSAHPGGIVLPGELLGAAFLYRIEDHEATRGRVRALLGAWYSQPDWVTRDPLEAVLALDWAWDALPGDVRSEYLLAARERARPLTPADSPLEPRVFREKLAALALAVAVSERDDPGAAWASLRRELLTAGRTYFETTFPLYVLWRGLAPTSPAAAAAEESDTVLAVELAGAALELAVWPTYHESIGRWMEHYLLADVTHPALHHQFLRDDCNAAALTPAPSWDSLYPLTAHLLAARTRDPAAARVADRIEARLRDERGAAERAAWRWVPLAFDLRPIARADLTRLPRARNLGGAVVFRGGDVPRESVVWIEAGQPYLRRSQHFDAGHFLIRRRGHLAGSASADVALEAVGSKGGEMRLGEEPGTFDFAQFSVATIAHNAIVVWDEARAPRWYGELFRPVGGQRLIEDTCTDFTIALESSSRRTARQLAFGQGDDAAYLALDLKPAYQPEQLARYTREFVFFWDQALLVIDRIEVASERMTPTWVLQAPARPTVDERALAADDHVSGRDNESGVWRVDGARHLRWADHDGALWCLPLAPLERRVRVVGGPAERRTVPRGMFAGREYIGGSAAGFERIIVPAERHQARNAWFSLGQPTVLGPHFGAQPHWGRLEIEPATRGGATVFVTLLVTDEATGRLAPDATVERAPDALTIHARLGDRRATLKLKPDAAIGGSIRLESATTREWELPRAIEPDRPLATEPR